MNKARTHMTKGGNSTLHKGEQREANALGALLLLIMVLLWATEGQAHTDLNQWFTHGPANQIVPNIAVDPVITSNLYAGTTDGIFKNTDGGESWAASSSGLPFDPNATVVTVLALAIDPQNPSILYAGTDQPGSSTTTLFKSTDGGANWAPTGALTPVGGISAGALIIDPTSPEIQRTLYAGTPSGVFKTTDGGTSWTLVLNEFIVSLVLDPASPNTLYAGTSFNGVFKTTDGGTSWSTASNGLPVVAVFLPVRSLAIDPVNSNVVYAATSGDGVYKTTNGAGSWSAANTGQTNLDATSVAIDPVASSIVYAGTTGGGVFKSTDGGGSWNAFNAGLFNDNVQSLAIDPDFPSILYAGTSGDGVFRIQQSAIIDVAVKRYGTRGPNIPGMCSRLNCVKQKTHTTVVENVGTSTTTVNITIQVDAVPAAACSVNGVGAGGSVPVASNIPLAPGATFSQNVDLLFVCSPASPAYIDGMYVLRAHVQGSGDDANPLNNDAVETQTVK